MPSFGHDREICNENLVMSGYFGFIHERGFGALDGALLAAVLLDPRCQFRRTPLEPNVLPKPFMRNASRRIVTTPDAIPNPTDRQAKASSQFLAVDQIKFL